MSEKGQSILMGALVAGLLSTSYLGLINLACCAGVIIGAVVGVWHYTNEHTLTIRPGEGAAMGALIGIGAMVVAMALEFVLGVAGIPGSEELIQSFQERMFLSGDISAEQREQMQAQQEQFQTPIFKVLGFFFGAAVSAGFGAIGGALGASMFKKGGELDPLD